MELAVATISEQPYLGMALQGVAVCGFDGERDYTCLCCKSVVLDCRRLGRITMKRLAGRGKVLHRHVSQGPVAAGWLRVFVEDAALWRFIAAESALGSGCSGMNRSSSIKDVRAYCLCASLLRTQFMSQRHATSCTSARARKEIYSHEGMVSVALTLLRFNLLG